MIIVLCYNTQIMHRNIDSYFIKYLQLKILFNQHLKYVIKSAFGNQYLYIISNTGSAK